MDLVLEACLWLAGKLTRQSRDRPSYPGYGERQLSRGILGMILFFTLVVGVPVLVVVWGFATGQLPAASPHED